jgi:hypothetical protein
LQDCKERRCQQEARETGTFSTGTDEFANNLILQSTGQISSQSTGMLHLFKFMANATQI